MPWIGETDDALPRAQKRLGKGKIAIVISNSSADFEGMKIDVASNKNVRHDALRIIVLNNLSLTHVLVEPTAAEGFGLTTPDPTFCRNASLVEYPIIELELRKHRQPRR